MKTVSHHTASTRTGSRAPDWRRIVRTSQMALWAAFIALASVVTPYAAQPARAEVDAGVAEPSDEIVYIDADGFIRVIDPTHNEVPQVQWVSPTGDWREFALGDFNNDSDMEIIAIKGDGTEAKPGIVAIFDPVVYSGSSNPGQKINGIPWQQLFQLDLGHRPAVVAAGDFDTGVPGDEFLVGMDATDPNDSRKVFRIDIYKQTTATPDGRNWTVHVGPLYSEEKWTRVSVGQAIKDGAEEYALVDDDSNGSGKVQIWKVEGGVARIYQLGDSRRSFNDAVFGKWRGSEQDEVAIVRNPDLGQVSLLILRWDEDDDEFSEELASVYDPAPRRLIFADTNSSGRDELFLLRSAPSGTGLARLFNLTRGNDNTHEWNEVLEDNEWRALAAGNVDGEPNDELIIGRADKIRVYTQPERNTSDMFEVATTFNRRSIATGNLDAIGFVEGATFAVDKTEISTRVPSGGVVSDTFSLRNGSTAEAVPFSITAENAPGWLTINPATGNLPANGAALNVRVNFNAAGLLPGIYRSRLKIDSVANVLNKPIDIVITFTVEPAQVTTNPNGLLMSAPVTPTEVVTETQSIIIGGNAGTRYTAAILSAPEMDAAMAQLGGGVAAAEVQDGVLVLRNAEGVSVDVALPAAPVTAAEVAGGVAWPSGVPWATLESNGTTVPDVMRVTFDTSGLPGSFDEGMIFIFPDASAGNPPESLRLVPIFILRTSEKAFMPLTSAR